MATPGIAVEKPPSDPSIPPANGNCPWDNLANELKDHIFWFAYIPKNDVSVVDTNSRGSKIGHSTIRDGDRFRRKIKEYPGPYINSFLVSKSWLKAAWQLFLAHAMLSFGCRTRDRTMCALARFISLYHTSSCHRNVLTPWSHKITQLTVVMLNYSDDTERIQDLPQLPCLRHLRLRMSPAFFLRTPKIAKNVEEETLAAPDFRELWTGWTVPRTCHVTVEEAIHTANHYEWDYEGPIFLKNLKTFERLLNIHIQQPQLEDKDIPETPEEIESLISLNLTGFLALLRGVKKERMARQLQPAEEVEGDQAGSG